MPFGYVCVHRSRAHKLLHMYVCVFNLCVAWFKNFMYSSTVNNGSPAVVLVKGKLSRVTIHAEWVLNCGPSLRSARIKGVLL